MEEKNPKEEKTEATVSRPKRGEIVRLIPLDSYPEVENSLKLVEALIPGLNLIQKNLLSNLLEYAFKEGQRDGLTVSQNLVDIQAKRMIDFFEVNKSV